MSLTAGLIAVKGQHSDKLSEIFNFFKLLDTNNDTVLNNWNDVLKVIDAEYMSREDNSQRRVVWFDKGWTIIEDLSLALCVGSPFLVQFKSRIFSCFNQSCWA